MKSLYNKYLGKRCFILGNGPSLNAVNFDLLKREITFGVNSIFLKTKENGFSPTFYTVEDTLVFSENKDEIDSYITTQKILPKQYAEQLTSGINAHIFDMDTSYYESSNKNFYGLPQFNIGEDPIFYCGQSVTYINMQIAYYLGFSEVYLVGMDFSYTKPTNHHQNGNHIKSYGDDPNHFHKDYFGSGKTWKDPRLGRVQRSYLRAKFEFEADGRSIFNATNGGLLEVFDRVDINCILED